MKNRLQNSQTGPEAAGVGFAQTRERAGLFTEEGLVAHRSPDVGGGSAEDPKARASSLLLRLPPPLVYVAAFLLGVGLQHLVPVPLAPRLEAPLQAIGAVMLALGILLGPANALMFLARGTTLNPARAPKRLFTGGIYRITRNPMYIGLLLVYAGVALVHAQAWALLLIAVPIVLVDRIYIPFEEQRLAATFGDTYLSYCQRVRRWLGVRHRPSQKAPARERIRQRAR